MTYPLSSARKIRAFFKKCIFGRNIFCPACRSHHVVAHQGGYRCKKCSLRFSLLSHTFLKGAKLDEAQIIRIVECFVAATPVNQAMRLTGLSEKAVRHWYALLRAQLPQNTTVLSGLVQVDELYMGGRKGRAIIAGKAVVPKHIAMYVCQRWKPTFQDFTSFFQTRIAPGSHVCTDGHPSYRIMPVIFPITHQRDNHGKFEFTHTSEIEGVFGTFRTFIRRMYHHISYKYLEEYCVEFEARFSHKEYFLSAEQFLLKTLRPMKSGQVLKRIAPP